MFTYICIIISSLITVSSTKTSNFIDARPLGAYSPNFVYLCNIWEKLLLETASGPCWYLVGGGR